MDRTFPADLHRFFEPTGYAGRCGVYVNSVAYFRACAKPNVRTKS
jgi:hypothetical protein